MGGGRTCSFAELLPAGHDLSIVAVDLSPDELAANTTAKRTIVADVSRELPFADGELDLLVSRTLLEHVSDVQGAARQFARVLKPGAHTIHLLPCRYALFAIFARVIPFAIAKRMVHFAIPGSRGVVEFDVVYDRGHPAALAEAFTAAGFREVTVDCTWDQTDYFQSLLPLFALVMLYQRVAARLGLRVLASYAIIRAVR